MLIVADYKCTVRFKVVLNGKLSLLLFEHAKSLKFNLFTKYFVKPYILR